ncbi:MAG: PLDc N-terminal domain-containing protein [Chitinophagaceae bacterium]|nr:PLDc N-terminal domain-containing protein [Chitinophagaceae bacterium]
MKLGTIVKLSFIASLIVTIIGAYLKITHWQGAEALLVTGVITTLIFIVSAIYEVRTSRRIDHTEKTMWTIAFIFFSGIAGIIYFSIGRKRIARRF